MKKIGTLIVATILCSAFAAASPGLGQTYRIQPGDVLDVSVWDRENMRRSVLVLPDGTISYPLAGHLSVVGNTAIEVETILKERLVNGGYFVRPPALTVSVAEARGYQIFVMGRVHRPGAITPPRRVDVMQALSLAGGLDEFANLKGIIVIRRSQPGDVTRALPLNYAAISSGRDMSSNILLAPGDVVVVPEAGLF